MEEAINNIKRILAETTDQKTKAELQAVLDSWNLTENIVSGIILNLKNKTITIEGTTFNLTYQEFKTLELLAASDSPMDRNEILKNAWDFTGVGARTVDVHIRKLRKKLGNELIVTRKGVGYAILKEIAIED